MKRTRKSRRIFSIGSTKSNQLSFTKKRRNSLEFQYENLERRELLNASPVANFDPLYTTPLNSALTISTFQEGLLGNDFDAEGNNLTAVQLTSPSHGGLTLNSNGTFDYTPDNGYSGVDSFFYQANDGNSNSRYAEVQISVGAGLGGRLNHDQRIQDNSLHSGGLTLIQDLADDMRLVYRSDANGTAIVVVDTFLTPGTLAPNEITAHLTFGGISQGTVSYDPAGLIIGDPVRFAMQADNMPTGMYDWSMQVTLDYGTSTIVRNFFGSQAVVNRMDSEFGSGWNLDGLDRLHVSSTGALLVEGDGTTLWYGANGASWYGAKGDLSFATLTESSGTYYLTDKWGNQRKFDSSGYLTAVKRVNNNVDSYTFHYDASNLLEKITDEFGRDFTFEYDNNDKIEKCGSFSGSRHTDISVIDGLLKGLTQNSPEFAYDLPPLDAYVAPHWVFDYTETNGLQTCTARHEPGVIAPTTYSFDDFGLLEKIIYPDGNDWELFPTLAEGLRSGVNQSIFKVSQEYARYEDERGLTHEFTTDHYGNVTSSIAPDGGVTRNDISFYGLLYQQTGADPDGPSKPQLSPITKLGYNFYGDLLVVVNPDNTTQTAVYHAMLHVPLTVTDELGQPTTFVVDSVGNVLFTTDPEDHTWSFTWNSHGNMLTQTSPDPDGVGLPLQPLTTIYQYESTIYNRLQQITNPDQTTQSFTYSDTDLIETVTDEIGRVTSYLFDPLDRLVQLKQPNPGFGQSVPTWTFVYDANRLLAETIDPLNNSTNYEYNNRKWVKKIKYTDPDGSLGTLGRPEAEFTYFPTGDLLTATNPAYASGLYDLYNYDGSGRMISMTGPLSGQLQTFEYDKLGRLIESEDASGRIIETKYDIRDRVVSVIDHDPDGPGPAIGPTYSYQYDLVGRLEHVTDPLNRVTSYDYEDNGWLHSVTLPDPDGIGALLAPVTVFGYDALGRQTSITDPLQRVVTFDFDEMGRIEKTTVPNPTGSGAGLETDFTYDDAGRLDTVRDPLENVTDYDWDGLDRLVKLTLPDPDGDDPLTSPIYEYQYDLVGNLRKVIDPLIHETDFEYDDLYRQILVKEQSPANLVARPEWSTVYGDDTLVESTTDPLNRQTTYGYDDAGRLTSVTEPLNRTTAYGYDLLDRLKTITSPDPDGPTGPSVTTFNYDIYSRIESTIDAENGTTLRTWDDAGQLLSLTDSVGNQTRWAYDGLGRVTMENNSLDKTIAYDYDAIGNVTRIADRNGQIRKFTYDSLDRPDAEQWFEIVGGGASISAATTTEGGSGANEVQTVTINDTAVGTFRLSFGGETTAPIFVTGSSTLVETSLEALETIDDVSVTRSGDTFTVTFLGDLADTNVEQLFGDARAWSDGTNIHQIDFGFDDANRLTSAADSFGSLDFILDGLGRVTSETQTVAGLTPAITLDSVYDAAGNRTKLEAKIGTTKDFRNTYVYDKLDRLITLRQTGQAGNPVTNKLVVLTYNALGQFKTINRFQATKTTGVPALRTFYTYDNANRLDILAHRTYESNGSNVIENRYIYTYDKLDRIINIYSPVDGGSAYTYDKTSQLLTADHTSPRPDENFTYDFNGNRTGGAYATGGNNETTTDANYTYQYDGEGNRTRRTLAADNSYEEYEFDHRNRLVAVTFFSSTGVVQKTVGYAYDPFNRLIRRTVDLDGPGSTDPVDQFFSGYDGLSPTLEFDGSEATDVSHRYLWGPEVDLLLADEQVTTTSSLGNVLWPLADHLGTIRDIGDLDEASPSFNIMNHLVYDSFGNLTSQTDPLVKINFAYTGKFMDDQTGYSLHWNRWFDPQLGKWISQDPIGFGGGDTNLSRYVGNDSTNASDPTGLVTQVVDESEIGSSYSGSLHVNEQDQVASVGIKLDGATSADVLFKNYPGLKDAFTEKFGETGLALLDIAYRFGWRYNTAKMPWALFNSKEDRADAVFNALEQAINDDAVIPKNEEEALAVSDRMVRGGGNVIDGLQRAQEQIEELPGIVGTKMVVEGAALLPADRVIVLLGKLAKNGRIGKRLAKLFSKFHAPNRTVVLGLDTHLDDFAKLHNGKKVLQLAEDPVNWKGDFYKLLSDPNAQIKFNLTNVDVWPGVTRASSGKGFGATDWELLQIYSNKDWWPRIKWFDALGNEVPNPFK